MQTLELTLLKGESIYSQGRQMAWMDDSIKLETNAEGGVWESLKRSFAGGGFFLTEYETVAASGYLAFAPRFPGQIVVRDLADGQSIVCRKETFLCAERSVHLEMYLQKDFGVGVFSGEGFVLQKVSGPGKVFLDLSGEIIAKELAEGQRLRVHPGHIGAQASTVTVDLETIPGVANALFGSGFWVAVLRGPGEVLLQSMPIEMLAAEIKQYLPHDPQDAAAGGVLGSILGAAFKRV
jgi:uncharacterized protein (TIGR00266 family)